MSKRILIIQTAFIGDLILTLPVIQELKNKLKDSLVDLLCIPETKEIIDDNPYLNDVIIYDKRNDKSISGLRKIIRTIRNNKYDYIISPHRSFRSSLISYFSGCDETIGFNNSSFKFIYKYRIEYINGIHEIERSLKLLEPLGIVNKGIMKPQLFISKRKKEKIKNLLDRENIKSDEKFIVTAPGSVWFTKRFPSGKFVEVFNLLSESNIKILLVGSAQEKSLTDEILSKSINKNIINLCGELSILETSELIRLSQILITNDSAPLHLANAVGTKTYAIFGATVPSFGFYPYGENDFVFETDGLKCRPCSIHGGRKCPVKSFDCMNKIPEDAIANKVLESII
jgi:heptosyltransferase II